MNETEIRWLVFFRISPWLLMALVVIIGMFKSCSDNTNPIDHSINKSREFVETVFVLDRKGDGFRVTYITTADVTKARLDEIQSRSNVQLAFNKMKNETDEHFKDGLLNVDIYDFALYARGYDCDSDITINCIFVSGSTKMKHYVGPNPSIPNSARWIDPRTEQGNLYIKHSDIYGYERGDSALYRYYQCRPPFDFSYSDEHFSHFPEDQRIR